MEDRLNKKSKEKIIDFINWIYFLYIMTGTMIYANSFKSDIKINGFAEWILFILAWLLTAILWLPHEIARLFK